MDKQPGSEPPKIYITGTGRCGTTFLIKLFTFLDFSTGYTRANYREYISSNCNSGMEQSITSTYHVIKTPQLIRDIHTVVNHPTISIQSVIIPVRDMKSSAASRVKHGNLNGGLWNAHDEESQIRYYEHVMTHYLEHMVKYDIPTIFLDFDKMISDVNYVYDKLFPLIGSVCSREAFSAIYEEVSDTSRPTKKE